ncbi:MAG: dTMP kinase [Bacilli bacterium]
MKKGLFISIEGPDGSGKSTQLGFIKEYIDEKNIKTLFTREPGGTAIGEKIREIILDKNNTEMASMTEVFLYAAARAQIVNEVIKPNIEKGNVVICDRFVDSSIAYQGYGRGLGDCVSEINSYAVDGYMPDYTFFLKLDSSRGLKRIESDNSLRKEKDRIEEAGLEFHQKVLKGYMELEDKFKDRIIAIDASQSIEDVRLEIRGHLDRILESYYGC